MVEDTTLGYKVFTGINYIVLALFAIACFFPFIYVLSASFTTSAEMIERKIVFIPRRPTLETYQYILSAPTLMRSMMNSVYVTVVGTVVNIILTVTMAYPLSHKEMPGRKFFNFLVIFTMLFQGGIIPSYILVKDLGLMNSHWSLILPSGIAAFNLIILRNFFSQIPPSLAESAKIDGASDWRVLLQIVLPLSKAALASISLFYAVAHWNSFFQPLLYLHDNTKWTVQIMMRMLIIMAAGIGIGDIDYGNVYIPPQGIKMATIVVATLPIMLIYPFLQKYFAKGVMMGSVKG